MKNFQEIVLRPLKTTDAIELSKFLENLSPTTRKFYKLDSFDLKTAQQMCDDIGKYDKLRFIAEMDSKIVGLFEFSMDIPEDDFVRFESYGIKLNQGKDCRFGPCIANELQGTGFGTQIFPHIIDIAKKLGQERIILWGGVFAENQQAIRFYEKNGFKEVGRFKNSDGVDCIDMMLNL